ncbi:MAG TPA: nucleoside hydrolase [Bryobacteraceae bacterium]|nr:nucleoside hydrolase [Bryobacteraceae bacterium]
MRRSLVLIFMALFVLGSAAQAAEPVRLILDTDIGNDIDDALALAIIHSLENRAEARLLAVTITKDNRWSAPYVDLVDTFYGRPDIPIGVVHKGKTREDSNYTRMLSQRRDSSGNYVLPHRIAGGSDAPDAVSLLQRVLEQQPDGSVTIVQIGFSTNLTRLLKEAGGRELVKHKVKLLCLMAGNFVRLEPEYNVYTDADAAQYLFANWPTPMIFSGFEIGERVQYAYENVLKDFNYTDNHPIAEAFKIFQPAGKDRPNWDSTAVLYAIRPDRGYFDLSEPGRVSLGPKHTTVFTPDPNGNCRYLILKSDQILRVEAVIETLVSEPPLRTSLSARTQQVAF